MRLGIDVRKLGDGGIGEYIRETLVAIAAQDPALEIVAFGNPGDEAKLPLAKVEWIPVRAGKYSLAEHVKLPGEVKRSAVELFHAPHYVLPFGLSCPSVVTIHDLIHVLLPRTVVHPVYARTMIGAAVKRAGRVITVSEHTAKDLVREFPKAESKVRVVPNGVSARFRPLPEAERARALAEIGVAPPYVLFVGNFLPHKNVEVLVRAWAGLAEPRPALVLCGNGYGPKSAVAKLAASLGVTDGIRAVGPRTPDELVALYGGAEMLASASLYEGFCLPVVEAFACGTAVVAPDAGAVPEVAGDAALLVPPQRVDTIREGMYRLLVDRDLRKGLIARGFRRAQGFSWERAAERTREVYEEVLSHSRRRSRN